MWLGGLVQFCPGFPGHTFATSHDIHKKSVLIKGLTCLWSPHGKGAQEVIKGVDRRSFQMSAGTEARSGARDTRMIARNSRKTRVL